MPGEGALRSLITDAIASTARCSSAEKTGPLGSAGLSGSLSKKAPSAALSASSAASSSLSAASIADCMANNAASGWTGEAVEARASAEPAGRMASAGAAPEEAEKGATGWLLFHRHALQSQPTALIRAQSRRTVSAACSSGTILPSAKSKSVSASKSSRVYMSATADSFANRPRTVSACVTETSRHKRTFLGGGFLLLPLSSNSQPLPLRA